MKKLVFYKCEICGNVAIKLVDSGVPMFCCGMPMSEIAPNSTDASTEKHKPVVSASENQIKVTVGEVLHPMTAEHYISHIVLETEKGVYIKNLLPTDQPTASFLLEEGESALSAYSVCNLHGMWMSEIE